MNKESVSTRIKRFDTGFIFMWIRLVFVKLKKLQNTLIQIKQDHRALNNDKKYYNTPVNFKNTNEILNYEQSLFSSNSVARDKKCTVDMKSSWNNFDSNHKLNYKAGQAFLRQKEGLKL